MTAKDDGTTHACVQFPELDTVRVCIHGDAITGEPMAIDYKIRGFNDAACQTCNLIGDKSNLHGNACKVLSAIEDFLYRKNPLDASILDNTVIENSFKTAFSKDVIAALRATKPGDKLTYGELARRAGYSQGAARAVGNVMRHNPFPIIIPCHRVVSPNGLGGYSGDVNGISLDIKQHLLDMEASMKQA